MKLKSKDQIRTDILASTTNAFIRAGIQTPNTGKSSHFFLFADSIATTLTGMQADLNNDLSKELSGQDLDDYATNFKLSDGSVITRRKASQSTGFIKLKVSNSNTIYIDKSYTLSDAGGRYYSPIVSGYYSNNAIIQIQSISSGSSQNIPSNTTLTWRQIPIFAVPTLQTVTQITGGTDLESDTQLLERIKNAQVFAPAGSSQDVINFIMNNVSILDNVFIYPCSNGPASCHVVLSGNPTVSTSFTKQVSSDIVNKANQLIQSSFTQTANFLVQSVQDNPLDITFNITSSSWKDQYPLPHRFLGDGEINSSILPGPTYVLSTNAQTSDPNNPNYYAPTQIVFNSSVDFTQYQSASNSNISISWISAVDFTIVSTQIKSFTQVYNSATNPYWTITATLQSPLNTASLDFPTLNGFSYIFPTNTNTQNYLQIIKDYFATVGAGEKYDITSPLFSSRTSRYPYYLSKYDSRITVSLLNNLLQDNTISNIIFDNDRGIYDFVKNIVIDVNILPLSSESNGSVESSPFIYTPRNLAFYPIY